MKSDVIQIDSLGNGFGDAVKQAGAVAAFKGLNPTDSLHLQLLTEEMLSMLHSVTGNIKGSFWIEDEDGEYRLVVSAKTVLDSEQRRLLISSATSRKNAITSSFLGRLRDAFEEALASETERSYFQLNEFVPYSDLSSGPLDGGDWDCYERSVLLKLADDVKVAIKGSNVTLTVTKKFAK